MPNRSTDITDTSRLMPISIRACCRVSSKRPLMFSSIPNGCLALDSSSTAVNSTSRRVSRYSASVTPAVYSAMMGIRNTATVVNSAKAAER